jgi:succinate-acetate transporter protein
VHKNFFVCPNLHTHHVKLLLHILQILCGLNESKRNNLFYYTMFCFYGGIWLAVAAFYIVSFVSIKDVSNISTASIRAVYSIICIATLLLSVITLCLNKTICFLYICLVLSGIFLAIGVDKNTLEQTETIDFQKVGGYFGLVAAAISIWLGFVELINATIGNGNELIQVGQWHFIETIYSKDDNDEDRRSSTYDLDNYEATKRKFFPQQHPPYSPKSELASEHEITFSRNNNNNNNNDDPEAIPENNYVNTSSGTSKYYDTTEYTPSLLPTPYNPHERGYASFYNDEGRIQATDIALPPVDIETGYGTETTKNNTTDEYTYDMDDDDEIDLLQNTTSRYNEKQRPEDNDHHRRNRRNGNPPSNRPAPGRRNNSRSRSRSNDSRDNNNNNDVYICDNTSIASNYETASESSQPGRRDPDRDRDDRNRRISHRQRSFQSSTETPLTDNTIVNERIRGIIHQTINNNPSVEEIVIDLTESSTSPTRLPRRQSFSSVTSWSSDFDHTSVAKSLKSKPNVTIDI